MSDLIEKINKMRLQAQLSPLGGATCDARLLFNVLDEVEEYLEIIESADSNEAIKDLDNMGKWELANSCMERINESDEFNTIKQALIQANHYLSARRNGKTLEQMHQLVQYSGKPMKPAVWIARIDGKLEQRVVMEKEDYDKLEDKLDRQNEILAIIMEKPYECAATLNYIQINKDNPKMLDYEHYSMAVKYILPEEDFERLVRYITNEKTKD